MAEGQWDKVGELFEEARKVPPGERRAFLEEACEEESVRTEVLSLLEAEDDAGGFFDGLAAALPSVLDEKEPGEAATSDPLDLEGTVVGRYRIEEHLGSGGMGAVYKAQDPELDRTVALKFLPPHLSAHPEAEERFVREARAAAALGHSNIATVHDIGETEEGRRFIAMAYYEGETLKEKIAQEGPLPMEEAVGYAEQIAEALSRAHEAGIVHRDVKPANVMVTEAGDVKLLDFGLAKAAAETRLTDPGRQMGTAAYMSPEQAEGKEVDARTDLWALGALLYEMLAGRRPFQGERKAAVIHSILHEEPPALRSLRAEVPAEVGSVVHRCLHKNPEERPSSAEALLEDLENLQATASPAEAVGEQLAGEAREGSAGGPLSWLWRFVGELRRRRVLRVAAVYAGTAFVILQLGEILVEPFGLPGWTLRLVTFLLILGFPLAVGLAWVFDVTEEGLVRTGRRVPALEGAAGGGNPYTSNGLIVALLVLAIGLFLYPRVFSGEEPATGQAPAVEAGAGRSVAVLPFEVSGAGAEEWQDGMVTALSLNLDGAAGLRSVADRTIFAALKERGKAEEGLGTEEALEVAREVGAHYAIVGSALQLGENLRLSSAVHRASSGERLGRVEVQGVPDSAMTLATDLTRKVLGVLLERSEEKVPSVALESITTGSLNAFKEFLKGERHLRAGEFEAAIGDYEAAVEQDSSFALAYARLATSRAWAEEPGVDRAFRRARELAGRLPRRERRLVRNWYIYQVQDRPFQAADSLRRLTSEYPNDPMIWYSLGEVLWHGNVPGGWPEADRAFKRAVELDPDNAVYYPHYVQLGISVHHDSTLAAKRLGAAPRKVWREGYQIPLDLAFGDSAARKAALARLDSIQSSTSVGLGIVYALTNPLDLAQREALLRHRARETDVAAAMLFHTRLEGGQVKKALAHLQELQGRDVSPGWLNYTLARSPSIGIPVPDSILQARLDPAQLVERPSMVQLRATGLYLIEQGRVEELGPLLDRIREDAGQDAPVVPELKGYRAFKAGDLERAAKLWAGSGESEFSFYGAIWRGDLYRRLGQLEKAEGWYQAAWRHPVAHEGLGRLYEEMGKPKKAAAAYRRFIEGWKNADPALQGRVQEARERLEALTGKKAAE